MYPSLWQQRNHEYNAREIGINAHFMTQISFWVVEQTLWV